jgi:hypothetical protein
VQIGGQTMAQRGLIHRALDDAEQLARAGQTFADACAIVCRKSSYLDRDRKPLLNPKTLTVALQARLAQA